MTDTNRLDYQWDDEKKTIWIKGLPDFDLKQTLECGQCFRWNKEQDGSYTGTAFSRVINIRQEDGILFIDNCTHRDFLDIWMDYFDFNRDYGRIKKALASDDPVMERVISFGEGIRLLKQDEWETLVSFIISQNANIPRIKKCIESLCQNFGKPIAPYRGKIYYTFPSPIEIIEGSKEKIEICRLGYRESYILKTAEQVNQDQGRILYNVKLRPRTEAEEYLLSLCGVGPKVAHCVLLFAMGYYDSFPIDVWMKRVMNRLYGHSETATAAMATFALNQFGDLSGFAQQYLFYYARIEMGKTIKIDKKKEMEEM